MHFELQALHEVCAVRIRISHFFTAVPAHGVYGYFISLASPWVTPFDAASIYLIRFFTRSSDLKRWRSIDVFMLVTIEVVGE